MNAHTDSPRVVVIGGGYSGTLAANHLRMRPDLDITLVNPRPHFVERIRLHQFVAGTYVPTVDYGALLGEGIRLVVDTATRIDTADRRIELASGATLDYDYVIYAVGSSTAFPSSVPGAAEFAYSVAELESAQRLRDVLDALEPDVAPTPPVTVVGGGFTGVETAAELAEQGHCVTLICGGQLVPTFSAAGRRSVVKTLRRLGVTLMETDAVTEVRRDAVVLADGAVRPSAVTIWATGFGVPPLAAASGLRTDELGRLLTDETLTSVDDERIVAAGDCASPSGAPLRMCCATATQVAPQAAETVLARIAGDIPSRFHFAYAGACISLGRRAGVLQVARRDDSPVNVFVGGRAGAKLKESICTGVVWALRRAARKPGFAFAFRGGPRPAEPVPMRTNVPS
ncbi:NAD(P)/FAD-dependent oxidoreductase [Mycolicibacterium phlei]